MSIDRPQPEEDTVTADISQETFDPEELLDAEQAAAILKRSARTLERWRYQGAPKPGLPYFKVGDPSGPGRVHYRRGDVIAFRKANTRKHSSEDPHRS